MYHILKYQNISTLAPVYLRARYFILVHLEFRPEVAEPVDLHCNTVQSAYLLSL